ncbi:MAG: hypothetical protein K8T91_26400 [Planctomycetes bacterium]|nr:hypothetical protein [Planctomycetota bacterium]
MTADPLQTALLDLDAQLAGAVELIIGGGYGLFLKQLYLQEHRDIKTLFPLDDLPSPRTTQDIDIILRAEVVTDSTSMKPIRDALDRLGFVVVESARYMQFTRPLAVGEIKIDLLSAPLGVYADRVPTDSRRVRPQPSVKLHARKLEEAVAVEQHPLRIPIGGLLSSGKPHQTTALIPQALTYAVMKLMAFRDRLDDQDKEFGRHHALDIYRIVGLITRDEDGHARALARKFDRHPVIIAAREVATQYFLNPAGLGRIRIREHQLATSAIDLEYFAQELAELLFPNTTQPGA